MKRREDVEYPRRMAGTVLVLNATYEPLNVTSVWRACSLILSRKAEVLEADPTREIRSPSTTLPHPVVIRLVAYVRVPRFTSRRITRRALFARDLHACQYCGSRARLTPNFRALRRGRASDHGKIINVNAHQVPRHQRPYVINRDDVGRKKQLVMIGSVHHRKVGKLRPQKALVLESESH